MRTAFDMEDAQKLRQILSRLIEHMSEDFDAVESQWANLQVTWKDQQYDQFEPQFEAIRNTLTQALENLENYLYTIDEKISTGEKAVRVNADLIRILGNTDGSYSGVASSVGQGSSGLSVSSKTRFKLLISSLKAGSVQVISATSTVAAFMTPMIAPMARIAVQINSPNTDTSISQSESMDLIEKANKVDSDKDDLVNQQKKREEDEEIRDAMDRDLRRKERRGVIFIEDD